MGGESGEANEPPSEPKAEDMGKHLEETEKRLLKTAQTTSEEDVELSIAFTSLKEMLTDKKLSKKEVDDYKKKYKAMHALVVMAHKEEKEVLKEAKALHNEALGEEITLMKLLESHEELGVEIGEKQTQRDKLAAELKKLEQVDTMLRYEVGELRSRRDEMHDKLEELRMENEALVQPELNRLRTMVEDTKAELVRLEEQDQKEIERKEELMKKLEGLEAEKKEAESNLETSKAALAKLETEPDRAKKQAESVEKAGGHMKRELKRLQARVEEADVELARMAEKRAEAEEVKTSLLQKLSLLKETIGHRQKDVEAVGKNLELERARHHQLTTEQLEVEVSRREQDQALRLETDSLSLAKKEFDALKRRLRKKRSMADVAASVLPALREQLREVQAEVTVRKNENKALAAQVEDAKHEVDVSIVRFLRQEGVEQEKREQLTALMEEVEELENELVQWAAEEAKQEKLVVLLSAQREIKAEEAVSAEQASKEASEQIKVKALVLADHAKRHHDVLCRLKEFSALYDVVKNERNKYVNLIQASNQALAEMKEKIKILQNEENILHNESFAKDRSLQKEAAARQASQAQRDALRLDANRASVEYRKRQLAVEQQIGQIEKLNSIINGLENAMLQLKTEFEATVESRNSTGMQLIDRNDELCILYEKANLQENALKKGEIVLAEKEADSRILGLQIAELQRRLSVTWKHMPDLTSAAERIVKLQEELQREREASDKLSKELEDPVNEKRWRLLEGEDPDREQLAARLQVLEERLSVKKEQLLEKELVLEEVTALTRKLRNQTNERKDETVELGKEVNNLQSRIRGTTRSMMATVSELSMYQATAMKLQQERTAQEQALEEARAKASRGEPPTEAAEREWIRLQRSAAESQRGQLEREDEEDRGPLPISLVRTTAEPRPNAYIPDEIGIPKPYGTMAPFKPTETGSTMRHIKVPQPKEIEI